MPTGFGLTVADPTETIDIILRRLRWKRTDELITSADSAEAVFVNRSGTTVATVTLAHDADEAGTWYGSFNVPSARGDIHGTITITEGASKGIFKGTIRVTG